MLISTKEMKWKFKKCWFFKIVLFRFQMTRRTALMKIQNNCIIMYKHVLACTAPLKYYFIFKVEVDLAPSANFVLKWLKTSQIAAF